MIILNGGIKMYYEIPGTVRIKKNSRRIFKSKKHKGFENLPSKAYMEWEDMARDYVSALILTRTDYKGPFKGPVHVRVVAYYKGPQPDLSGILESVGDAFEGQLWVNDKNIRSWDGSRLIHDKGNPRLCLWVEPFTALSYKQDLEIVEDFK